MRLVAPRLNKDFSALDRRLLQRRIYRPAWMLVRPLLFGVALLGIVIAPMFILYGTTMLIVSLVPKEARLLIGIVLLVVLAVVGGAMLVISYRKVTITLKQGCLDVEAIGLGVGTILALLVTGIEVVTSGAR